MPHTHDTQEKSGSANAAPQSSSKEAVKDLIDALNEDLAREYQAIIAYTVYSNVLSGAKWMNIAGELKLHATEELQHAMIVADQIDYLGGMPTATPKPVKLSDKAEEMLQFDLDNETETIKNYRQRVKQAEALGHYALAEQLRKIIVQEQEHQHDLATALGIDVPKVLEAGA
jgi:bacterioferritin